MLVSMEKMQSELIFGDWSEPLKHVPIKRCNSSCTEMKSARARAREVEGVGTKKDRTRVVGGMNI